MKNKIKDFYKTETIAKFLLSPLSDDCHNPIKAFLLKNNNFGRKINELNKEDSSIVSKILTGHNNLKKHLHRSNIALDPFCDFCEVNNEEETTMHILTDCIAFSKLHQ